MRRSLLALSLLAAVPGLARAQEPKLVNCRTLEAAGNFVGPDEVIVDDMVCQKAKPGINGAKAQPQPPKPVIGTTISDTPSDSIVDAAKAAGMRIAARKVKDDADAQKTAPDLATTPSSDAATPPPTPRPSPTPSADSAPPSPPPTVSSPPASTPDPPAVTPAVVSKSQPAAPSATPPPAEPPTPPATPAAAAQPAPQPEPAPTEIVITSAPSSTPAATSSATMRNNVPPAEVVAAPVPSTPQPEPVSASQPSALSSAEPAPASSAADAVAPPRPSEPVPPADPSHPATSSGFYDANAPKRSASAAPETNSGFATADQVNAGLVPGATSILSTSDPAAATEVPPPSPDPEQQHTSIAASRVGFDDPDRDRAVKLGDFAQPKEVSPDPAAEHRTSVDPSDADGFQDRQRPECTKNISLGGLKGERLVLGVPAWAAKWIEKNEKRMPEICFSETPMKSARNYLIVFSTPAGAASGKEAADAVLNPAKPGTASGVGTFTTSFGSTWHYSYDRNVGTTVLTQDDADEPHAAPGHVLYATAYTEEGVPVSQRWPGQLKKELKPGEKNPKKIKGETEALEHVSSDLLSQLVDDIAKF